MKTLICILISFGCMSQDTWEFRRDKQLHFTAGALTGSSVSLLTNRPLIYGIGSSVIIGAGKEVYDSFGNGTVSVQDFSYTLLGGVVGTVVTFYICKAIKKKNKVNFNQTYKL